MYVLLQDRENIFFGKKLFKLFKLIIISTKNLLYRVVRIDKNGKINDVHGCKIRLLSKKEAEKLTEVVTHASIPDEKAATNCRTISCR